MYKPLSLPPAAYHALQQPVTVIVIEKEIKVGLPEAPQYPRDYMQQQQRDPFQDIKDAQARMQQPQI